MKMNKNRLGLILSKLEGSYRKYLLQLCLSPELVAEILFIARKDIKDKVVYNLGCGTGRFAIGSVVLGAKAVYGIDLDRVMLDIAKENVLHVQHITGIQLSRLCHWHLKDVFKLYEKCDTVIQFPPINTDILFFMKALEIGRNVYSIHKPDREEELRQLAKKYKAKIFKVKRYRLTKGFLPEVILVVAKR
jgi:putative methylase